MLNRKKKVTYPILIQPHRKSCKETFNLTLTKAAAIEPELLSQLYNYEDYPYPTTSPGKISPDNLVLLNNKQPIAIILNKVRNDQQLVINQIIVHPMYPEDTIAKACRNLIQGFYARDSIN